MSIQIQFFGAAGTVTGSCSTVTCGSKRILIDCGVAQDKDCTKKKPFAFDPKTIDAVILTHAHLDHCGLVPVLFQQGYKGRLSPNMLPVNCPDSLAGYTLHKRLRQLSIV